MTDGYDGNTGMARAARERHVDRLEERIRVLEAAVERLEKKLVND